ncbi:MAG: PAS domain S-box protein [Methanoregula sp.]
MSCVPDNSMTKTLSVLYVDDEPDLLEIGKLFLEQSGEYSIDTSVSAADALVRLEQKKYDAIVSDYQMPVMNGIKFLQAVRNRGDQIPFIIFTGRGREDVIIEALNSGVDFYLQKGGEPKAQFAELINIIRKAVRQKSADDALKESEAKYRNILENIQDVYYRSDVDGNLILASPSMVTVLGYDSLSELYGENISHTFYYNPEQRKEFLAEINRSGSVTNYEVTLKKRDGTPVFVLTSSHKYYDPSGNFLGVEGIFRDITARKKGEDELRAAYEQLTAFDEEMQAQFDELKYGQDALRTSEKKLQGIVHGSPIPQFVIDKNHRVISWNHALERYSGVKADEVLGTSQQWKAFYPVERPCMADLLVDGTIDKIPEWYPAKYNKSKYVEGAYEATDFFPKMGTDGIWLYFTASTIKDSTGNIIGAVETLEDITEITVKEQALKASEEQYRNVIETQTEFICRFKPDGTHVFANEAYCRYFRKNCKELIRKKFRPEIYPEDHDRVKEHFSSFTRENPVSAIDHRIIMPDGSLRWQRWVDRAIFDEQGNITEYQTVGRDITDVKQAEEALRESESKLNAIVRGSPIPQFVIDKDHKVIQWNAALERYSGIKADEVLGTNQQWRAFYPKERPCMADLLVEGHIEKIPRWYSGKYTKSPLINDAYEATDFFAHMGPSGTYLHFTAALIRDSKGIIIGAVETLEDITAMKDAEKELKKNEEKYRNILDNIQDIFYRSDRNGNLIMISPSGAVLLGYDSPDDLIGLSIAGQIYAVPDDRNAFLDAMKEKGYVKDYEVKLRRKDGNVVTVATNSHFYYNPDGSLGGIEGIFRDITGMKHTEELLRESEALYRAVFDNTGAATIIIAPDTTILLANDRWEKLTGVPKEKQEHKTSWTVFIDKEDVERMKQYHYTRRKDPSLVPRTYECRLIDAAGHIHNCIVNVLMIPGSSNSVASLVDISDLKQAEEALMQINKKLNLMSSITRHDILNQLTALSGFTGLLKNHLTNDQDLMYISQSETAIQNIERQITFTKLYQDIGVNGPEWQMTATVIRQAVNQLSLGTITVEIDLNDIEIYADPLLVKVFYNLIDNSLRYGDKLTEIRFYSAEGPDGLVLFCLDDGVGIPGSEKDRIFDRGFGRHSGFGLFLAREILSITGLTIIETGEPGKGARFEMHIPKGAYRHIHQ